MLRVITIRFSRLLFMLLILNTVLIVAPPSAYSSPTIPTTPQAPTADLLPGDCIGVTPPGEPETPCCISGYVFIDGQIVAGAEVQIQNAQGDQVTTFTQVYSTSNALAHYRLNLNADPLNVTVGGAITITARYSSHTNIIPYIVQAGGQHVDAVLSRNYADDYVYERQIFYQDDPGTFLYPQGIAVNDRLGRIYVADSDNDRIQVFTKNGQFIKQWGHVGNAPSEFSQPRNLAIDSSDNVYVVDAGNNRIQKFNAEGVFITMWGGRGKAKGQFEYPAGIAIDQSQNIYTIEHAGRVQKFTSTGRWSSSWLVSVPAQYMTMIRGIAVDNNSVYIADYNNSRILKYSSNGVLIATWGNRGSANGQFEEITDLTIDRDGNLLVTDWWNRKVQKFTTSGTWLNSFGSYGSGNGQFIQAWGITSDSNGDIYVLDEVEVHKFTTNGTWILDWGSFATSSKSIGFPEGIAIDSNGNVYVSDSNRIQKYASDGTWIKNWGSYGSANGQFSGVSGVAVDTNNNIYVVDTYNNRIQKFTSDGVWLNSWGTYGSGNGQFGSPRGIVVDSNGDFYVTESDSGGDTGLGNPINHRVQKFDRFGNFVRAWGSLGTGNGQFETPKGIAIGNDGFIYVVDSGFYAMSANDRIQKFSKDGQWVATWGSYGTLGRPEWIALDPQNNVILPHFWNGKVQTFTSNGIFKSSFGKYGLSQGELDYPKGIARTTDGHLYIADDRHGRIQMFRPMTYTKPIATINHRSADTVAWNETLVIRGMGQDSDETSGITAYKWSSNRDGVLGSGATVSRPASSLSTGTHIISLQVQDDEGQWSDAVTTTIYVAPQPQAQWTMLLYLAGDYHDRSSQLNQFNKALSNLRTNFRNPNVRIAVQIDGPNEGDTRRLLITAGTSTTPPNVIETSIGERAMDDPVTLSDFIRWGQTQFPADHYYLSIANHGQAIQGIAWDTTSDRADDGTENDTAYLTVKELGTALKAPNLAPIDILHLDACSMNLLETAYEVKKQVGILMASQYLSWSFFAYDQYATAFGANTLAPTVATAIAQRYVALAQAEHYPFTMSVLDLGRATTTLSAVDDLAAELAALVNNNQSYRTTLDTIWLNSQRYESNGDYIITPSDLYIDLVDWTTRIQVGISSPAVKARAANLLSELTGAQPFILASYAQSAALPSQYAGGAYIDLSDSHGVSIFYPQSATSAVYNSYINNRLFSFTSQSRWADFLIAGIGASPPGTQTPPPGPLPTLNPPQKVFIPLITR